ncbi:hypothetical protein BH10BDE1_BH10BDE1_04190 [soil metagenome]
MRNLEVIKFVLLSMFAGVVLSGCSGGASAGEDARAQQAKDAATLQSLYSSVTGVWDGTVTNAGTGLPPFTGQLKLYMNYIADGSNPDGSPKLRPVLRGRFQPNEFIAETDTVTLTGDYDRSGRIVLTGSTMASSMAGATSGTGSVSSGVSDARIFSLVGSVTSAGMQLQLTRQGGVWGYFQGTRSATDASAPIGGEALEMRERFLRIYGPLEGRYFGTMKSVNGNDYKVEIAIVIIENGGSSPTLAAQYKRLDAPAGALEWNMVVAYDSQTEEVFMRESAASGGSSVPGGMILSVTGTLGTQGGKKTLNVTVRNKTAVLGTLEAIRN